MCKKGNFDLATKKINHHGFTLIEIAAVILIVSILTIPFFKVYDNYIVEKRINQTQERIDTAAEEVSLHLISRLAFPCPADPTLGPNDPNYGISNCVPGGGIVLAPGAKSPGQTILIGAVPINTLRIVNGANGNVEHKLSDDISLDAWGNKLVYAVTTSLTNDDSYSIFNGQIRAIDEFDQNTAGIDRNAHFAILSMGKNGKGAFTHGGTLVSPCTGDGMDLENCDNDSTFRSALGNIDAEGANYYDDYAYFTVNLSSTLWQKIGNTEHIANLNTQNIGVNIAEPNVPTVKLDINGILQNFGNTKVEKICEKDNPDKCIMINDINGDANANFNCDPNQVATGIYDGKIQCTLPEFPTPNDKDCRPEMICYDLDGAPYTCKGWVHGVTTTGDVICY